MYVKLFASILQSSIWSEDLETRVLWVSMLAMADRDGFVRASPSGLARSANLPLAACRKALAVLEAPDVESGTQQWGGRRIEAIEGGWQVLNYAKYRELRDPDARRDQVKEAVRRHREKSPVISGNPEQAQAEAEAEAEAYITGADARFVLEHLPVAEHRTAFLRLYRAAGAPDSFAASVRGMGPGGIRPVGTWDQVGMALHDAAATGGRITPNVLRGFIRGVKPAVGAGKPGRLEQVLGAVDRAFEVAS